MKVLQVTTHVNVGGIARYIVTLSDAIRKKGAGVVVASSGGDLERELDNIEIPHRRINIKTKFEFAPKVFGAALAIARIIKREGIEIVHAHSRVSQVASFFACRLTGIPLVTTCHGFFRLRSRKIFDTWGMKVIAISDSVRTHLKENLGVSDDRIELIYNGIDVSAFAKEYSLSEIAEAKKLLGLKDGPVVGTIGRLSPVKGHRFLIEAMSEVISKKPGAQALIVGTGTEEQGLKKMAGSLGVGDKTRFISSDINTPRLFSIMDIFVFPSIKEGLGLALLEALAGQKCCIASDTGGIRDVIDNGKSGMLVKPADTKALSKAIISLLDDPALRKSMGVKGREIVSKKFSLDSMAEKMIALYKKVLEDRK